MPEGSPTVGETPLPAKHAFANKKAIIAAGHGLVETQKTLVANLTHLGFSVELCDTLREDKTNIDLAIVYATLPPLINAQIIREFAGRNKDCRFIVLTPRRQQPDRLFEEAAK